MENKRNIKTIYLSLCSLAFILMMLVASSVYGENIDKAPAKWSLQFGIERDFQLGGFDGMQISIRKHCSALRAWQLGASLECRIIDDEDNKSEIGGDYYSIRKSNSKYFTLDVSLLHEWHPIRLKSINLLMSLGPEL